MAELALYLDTARLGLMSSSAQLAAGDFARLAGEEPFTLYGDRFVDEGVSHGDRHGKIPGLARWRGIRGLKQSIRLATGVGDSFPVLLASRTSELMRLATRILFQKCRNVLVTDTCWSPYLEILNAERRSRGADITMVPIRERLRRGDCSGDEVVSDLADEFCQHQCDGLFLAAISHDGIRLPVDSIVRSIQKASNLQFTAIDGAQDFCHSPNNDVFDVADLYLAGCHKWLGAYQPLGLAVAGRPRSFTHIEQSIRESADLDPLLRFTRQLETGQLDGVSETVNLTPLVTCQGALHDALSANSDRHHAFTTQVKNANAIANIAFETGWQPLTTSPDLRSGILMLQAERNTTRGHSPEYLRRNFAERGVLLTTYEQGQIRLSMPRRVLTGDELEFLRLTFRSLA